MLSQGLEKGAQRGEVLIRLPRLRLRAGRDQLMLCTARTRRPPGSRSRQWGLSGLYARSQAQTRTFVGWLAHAKKEGEEVCGGTNGGRRGCHDRPHGESPEPGCPFPPAAS